MKKLDWLIIKAFIGPFIITFFIALFVLFMQTVWKYVDDLVGKGLDFGTIGLFLLYMSATLLLLAMPIAILISSIMTFGNLGESFELVAIKSAGISLLRFMRPLLLFSIVLALITFWFANNVVPYATLKSATLYDNIMRKNPTLEFKEGIFYTAVPNYAIKVGRKDPDKVTIHDVTMFDATNPLQDNCIVAQKGKMRITPDEKFLEFDLYNGYRYQEKGNVNDSANEYIRMQFKTYKKLFDISSLQSGNTTDSMFMNDCRMYTFIKLQTTIDSLKKQYTQSQKRTQTEETSYFKYANFNDSLYKKIDTAKLPKITNTRTLFADSLQQRLYERASGNINSLAIVVNNNRTLLANKQETIRSHYVEWHRKFAISLACIVLFFIGAPLGSIIRKGGIGMPLVVAIIFFLIFHLLNTFGEKFAREGSTSVVIGMWLAVYVLVPIGMFLTYKALNDSQLFNKEFYNRIARNAQQLFKKNKKAV
jgi:lipopolysaccharide export system permease protein